MQLFLWNKYDQGKYYAQIGWKTICLPKHKGGLGLKFFSQWNKAFLMKLLWIYYQKEDQPWVHYIWAKYLYNTNIESAESKAHHSPFWKSLLMVKDNLFLNTSTHLGKGDTTPFWYDKWLLSGPLAKQIVNDPPAWCAHYRVSQMLCNGHWNTKLLNCCLPPSISNQIQQEIPSVDLS